MTDLRSASVAETVRLTSEGDLTPRVVVDEALDRIASLDPGLNAFSVVLAERAHEEAVALGQGRDTTGPLHGVPIAIKEEVDVAGCVTTFGGEANTTPAAADAELVARLRAAGAVIVGKTTMPEFGAYPYTEGASRGITRNPDTGRLQRRYGGRGGLGHGAGRHRR